MDAKNASNLAQFCEKISLPGESFWRDRRRHHPMPNTPTSKRVKVYTAGCCCYCHMAKELLRKKGAAFEEIDLTGRSDLRDDLRHKAGGRNTVPQIWIGDTHVGGCDDLLSLDRAGKLDALLAH